MRFGINTFLFTSPFTNQSTKLFGTFKKWGFETVEIPIEDPSHIDPLYVRGELDRHGLVCGSACACMGPGRDFRGTPAEQETAMVYCKALIDQMVVLDCLSLVGRFIASWARRMPSSRRSKGRSGRSWSITSSSSPSTPRRAVFKFA